MATLARLNVTLALQAQAFERGVRQAQAATQQMERGLVSAANRASTAVNSVGRATTNAARTIERGLSNGARVASRAASQMDHSLGRIGDRLSSLGTKATIAAGAIVAAFVLIAGSVLTPAINAVESENLFEVSLGRQAKAVRQWSEELEDALGVSARATRTNVATFTAMFKGMEIGEGAAVDMSKGLVLLANDMSSFFNLQPEEAFEKLRAGIVGETEPLKALGIVVNETTVRHTALRHGLIGANDEMSEAQKVVARYLTILEQTSLAQGDLARTIESPANQLRIAQQRFNEIATNIGTKFLPILTTALNWLNDEGLPRVATAVENFGEKWGELSDEVKRRILFISALLVFGGPLLKALGVAMTAFDKFAKIATSRLGLIAIAGASVAAVIFQLFGQDIATLLSRTGFTLQKMGIQMQKDAAMPLGKALKVMGIDLDAMGAGLRSFGADLMQAGFDMSEFREKFAPIDEAKKLLAGDFSGLEKLAGATIPALDAALEGLEETGLKELQKLVDDIDKAIGFDAAANRAANAAKKSRADLVEAMKPPADIRKLWQEAGKGIADAGDKAKSAREQLSKLSEALTDARQRLQDLARPVLKGMTQIDDTLFFAELERDRRRLARVGRRFGIEVPDLMTEEGRRIVAGLPRGRAGLDRFIEAKELERRVRFAEQERLLQAAANGVPQEMTFEEALRAIAVTKAEIASLEPQIAAARAAAEAQEKAAQAETLASANLATSASASTKAANSLTTAANTLTQRLSKIPILGGAAQSSSALQAAQSTGPAADMLNRLAKVPLIGGTFKPRARGGPFSAGDTLLVGEEGPELARFGSSGSIVPHETLAALASGGGTVVTVTIQPNGIVVQGADDGAGHALGQRIVDAIVEAASSAGAPARPSLPGAVGV